MRSDRLNLPGKLGLGLILVCGMVMNVPGQEPADGAGAGEQSELVWPQPPAQPRIRWVAGISMFGHVQGFQKPKKLSFFERLAGVEKPKVVEQALGRPYGIAVDSRDRIYVADGGRRSVVIFDRANHKVEEWGRVGRGIVSRPHGIAIDAQDNVYVSDIERKLIIVYDKDGRLINQFGINLFNRPAGLAIDRKREVLYVADSGLKQVLAFSLKDLTLIRRLGERDADRPSEVLFDSPANVAVDGKGFLYVSDQLGKKLFVFNRRGKLRKEIGQYGTSLGDLGFPKGVGVDSEGHVYVADAWFNNFQIFDEDGQVLLFVGERGTLPGQFLLLAGLYVDDKDRIYTTDFSGRLQIFEFLKKEEENNGEQGGDTSVENGLN